MRTNLFSIRVLLCRKSPTCVGVRSFLTLLLFLLLWRDALSAALIPLTSMCAVQKVCERVLSAVFFEVGTVKYQYSRTYMSHPHMQTHTHISGETAGKFAADGSLVYGQPPYTHVSLDTHVYEVYLF